MFNTPLLFQPIFQERIWGGRRLAELYAKALPEGAPIGESWELVDRPEAQSVVRNGSWRGTTLHELWTQHRAPVFGDVRAAERFPVLLKLLDAREKLSLQVHPPATVAKDLGGEPKTEFWYVAAAEPGATLYVGLKAPSSRAILERALDSGTVEEHVHCISVKAGDAMFLPSGRMHAIGAGIVIFEIQENSDTTYRVFDWNRRDAEGRERELHIEASLACIDYNDVRPELRTSEGESLVKAEQFEIEKWELKSERPAGPSGHCAIIGCLTGRIACGATSIAPGEFMLIPASLEDRTLRPSGPGSTLLRITLPAS